LVEQFLLSILSYECIWSPSCSIFVMVLFMQLIRPLFHLLSNLCI
uniref:Ovule protein n=1 Tax=Rodentolepis nana TaxID=102285 RepID=A0A0R3TAM2_RODNA